MKGRHWKKKKVRQTYISVCECGRSYHQYADQNPIKHCPPCLAISKEKRLAAGIVQLADGLQYKINI